MAKIAYLGAGSLGFGPRLIGDLLSYPALAESELRLVDPNAERLALIEAVARRMVADEGLPTQITTASREQALDGADYVIASIRVGVDEELLDINLPLEVGGLRQTVADTVGIGGVMKGLRSIPPLLEAARDMERLCPDALLLNYTNPMAMIQWTLTHATSIATVGLCHSVQYTSEQLSGYMGIEREQLRFRVAGINHMAWFTELTADGEDLYPRLRACLDVPETVAKDRVRFEIFKEFGWFVTESSRHMAEYVPYVMQHDEEVKRLEQPWRDSEMTAKWRQHRIDHEAKLRDSLTQPTKIHRSNEYGARIIHARETNAPLLIHGNVRNTGLIPNLLPDCCVEVPVLVDGAGLRPCHVDPLPPQCAGLCSSNIAMQGLVVKAVLEQDPEAAIHAAMLDPNTAAQMTLAQIRESMNQLFAAQAELMPWNLVAAG